MDKKEKENVWTQENTYVLNSRDLERYFSEELVEKFEEENKDKGLHFYDPRCLSSLQIKIFNKIEEKEDGTFLRSEPSILNFLLDNNHLCFSAEEFKKLSDRLKMYARVSEDISESLNTILSWKLKQFLMCFADGNYDSLIVTDKVMIEQNLELDKKGLK